jgi:DNA uptake protein ComE-like DNA-binding protein
VWYLDKEVADKVLQRFPVLSKPVIVQLNINTTDFKTVMKLPYMDYELTKKIFNYKNAAGKITTMDVLKKLEGFPLDKFDRISLYLKAE